MKIQKYKARITGTDTFVIGYITEVREWLGNGCYGMGTDYVMSVTCKSMPDGNYGTHRVDKDSVELYN